MTDYVTDTDTTAPAGTQLTISGVDTGIVYLTHGNDRQVSNLGFIITIGDHRLFPSSDTEPALVDVN